MKLWIDVYDTDNVTRLGEGPIPINNVNLSRSQDAPATWNLEFSAANVEGVDLVQQRRLVKVYFERNEVIRHIITGIVNHKRIRLGKDEMLCYLSGEDLMAEFKNRSMKIPYNESLAVAAHVIGIIVYSGMTGWSFGYDYGPAPYLYEMMSLRVYGVTALAALQEIAKKRGHHIWLTEANNGRQIWYGPYHDEVTVRAIQPITGHPDLELNEAVLIERPTMIENSENIYNRVVAIGSGEGDVKIDLRYSDRTAPYTIQSATQTLVGNDYTYYYIEDAASIAEHGVIENVLSLKTSGPATNTTIGIKDSANTLYDAAVIYLERHKQPTVSYTFRINKLGTTNIICGTRMYIKYKGIVETSDGMEIALDIDGNFYVLSIQEEVSADGGNSCTIEVSEQDYKALDLPEILSEMVLEAQVNQLYPQLYPSVRSFIWERDIDPTHPAIMPLIFSDITTQLLKAVVTFSTNPFRSNVQSSAAGGDHNHYLTGIPSAGGSGSSPYTFPILGPSGLTTIVWDAVGTAERLQTFTASGDHTHPMNYGIYDDVDYPDNIELWFDGVDQTSALGGPWDTSGTGGTFVVDLTEIILAIGEYRTPHTVEFRCGGGKGRMEVVVDLYESLQAINL